MNYEKERINKIYSRKRLDLFKKNRKIRTSYLKISKKNNKTNKKAFVIFFIIILFAILYVFNNIINPIFDVVCEEKAKEIAIKIANEKASEIINDCNYDTFFDIEKDENQNIKMINANILKINQISSKIEENVQKGLNENEKIRASIPVGSLLGIKVLSGFGPVIPLKIATAGNVQTELKSEFESKGINQTLHRVYLEIEVNINVLTLMSTIRKNIKTQILIAENVIIGEIPETYCGLNQND